MTLFNFRGRKRIDDLGRFTFGNGRFRGAVRPGRQRAALLCARDDDSGFFGECRSVQCERDGACQGAKRKTRGSHNVVLLLDAIRNDNYYHLH